jgi:hypothetical protein
VGVVKSVLGAIAAPRTWLATIHVSLSLLVGVIGGSLVLSFLSTAAGLAITVVLALPFLGLVLLLARAVARIERARLRALLDVDLPDPLRPAEPARPPGAHPDRGSAWQRFRRRALSGAAWKEVAYTLALLPVGAIGFALATPATATAAPATTAPGPVATIAGAVASAWWKTWSGAAHPLRWPVHAGGRRVGRVLRRRAARP